MQLIPSRFEAPLSNPVLWRLFVENYQRPITSNAVNPDNSNSTQNSAPSPKNRATLPPPLSSFVSLADELLLIFVFAPRQTQNILAYLSRAEWKEPDVWLKDDYRIAWLTVLHCAEGISQPWEYAFWRYLGRHPDKLIPELVARAERHAAMETGQSHLSPNTHAASSPKKPVMSVKQSERRKEQA